MHCDLLIPALNEEAVIAEVLDSIPHGIIRRTVVVDNGSTDSTAGIAASGGAIVVHEPVRGYGSSMARGIRHLYKDPPDIVAFMDADGSDDAGDLSRILSSVTSGDLDLCIGSRLIGDAEAGSMHLLQHAGTRVACVLLRNLYGLDATDLGPLRAINWQSLMRLDMQDRAQGSGLARSLTRLVSKLIVLAVVLAVLGAVGMYFKIPFLNDVAQSVIEAIRR